MAPIESGALNHREPGASSMTTAHATQANDNPSGLRTATLAALKLRFGPRYADSAALREQHGHTTTWIPNQPPEAVIFPENTEEVVEIVNLCR
jgi:D-lactate dehydrogenase (cytochrome)